MIRPQLIFDMNDELIVDNFADGGGHTGVVAAHLTKFNTGSVGQGLNRPGPTVMAGSHSPETHGGAATSQGIVAAAMTKYYGTDQNPELHEPSATVTTKDRFGLVEAPAVVELTPEQLAGARRVAAFLREFGVEFEGEFATVGGYIIVDIGMRMLTPRELFRAQGFPETYVIDRAWVVNPKTGEIVEISLTKEQQIRMCGNSVCPQVMAAIVRANVPELAVRFKEDRKGMVLA